MIERWAIPVIPLGVEEAGKSLQIGSRRYDAPCYILKPDDVDRVRLGWVCIICLEQHPEPYPEQCSHCGFPMRGYQDTVFEKLYGGEVHVGPRTTLAEEMEIAQEIVERGGRE
jgi:hypothetical protein